MYMEVEVFVDNGLDVATIVSRGNRNIPMINVKLS